MKAIPKVSRDLSALDAPLQCVVFVELNVGVRERSLDGKREDVQLGKRLTEVLEAKNVGWYRGSVHQSAEDIQAPDVWPEQDLNCFALASYLSRLLPARTKVEEEPR